MLSKAITVIFKLSFFEEHKGDELICYAYRKGKHLAKFTPNETYFYGTDHLGSTTVMTDSNGEVVWRGYISPFGDSATGEGSIQEAVKFTGKELDPETGLYYFNARWYDPKLGKFITEDPARDGINWYVYVLNNPLRFIDPTGLESADAAYGWFARKEKYMNEFSYPVESGVITSAHGKRVAVKDSDSDRPSTVDHKGIDIANKKHTPIFPAQEGTVKDITYDEGYGHSVIVEHGYGVETKYSHLAMPPVLEEGSAVGKDNILGHMGSTGVSTGPHVHFEVSVDGENIDPSSMIDRPSSIELAPSIIEDDSGKIRNKSGEERDRHNL